MTKLKTLKDMKLSAEELARMFHDTYENFSITNKWKTQAKCQVVLMIYLKKINKL